MPQPPGQTTFQLRLQLRGVTPQIWRRLLVPSSLRLGRLHDIFQAATGWDNSHLHNFRIGEALYGIQFDEHPAEEINERDVTVLQALRQDNRFMYAYDFGDGWEHDVVVEARCTTPFGLKYAVCLDGEGACPPEDCGGPPGYAHPLQALADPSHADHAQLEAGRSIRSNGIRSRRRQHRPAARRPLTSKNGRPRPATPLPHSCHAEVWQSRGNRKDHPGCGSSVLNHHRGVGPPERHWNARVIAQARSESMESIVVSVSEAAELLGVSDDLVYELTARGDLPCVRFGRRKVIPRRAIELVVEAALANFDLTGRSPGS